MRRLGGRCLGGRQTRPAASRRPESRRPAAPRRRVSRRRGDSACGASAARRLGLRRLGGAETRRAVSRPARTRRAAPRRWRPRPAVRPAAGVSAAGESACGASAAGVSAAGASAGAELGGRGLGGRRPRPAVRLRRGSRGRSVGLRRLAAGSRSPAGRGRRCSRRPSAAGRWAPGRAPASAPGPRRLACRSSCRNPRSQLSCGGVRTSSAPATTAGAAWTRQHSGAGQREQRPQRSAKHSDRASIAAAARCPLYRHLAGVAEDRAMTGSAGQQGVALTNCVALLDVDPALGTHLRPERVPRGTRGVHGVGRRPAAREPQLARGRRRRVPRDPRRSDPSPPPRGSVRVGADRPWGRDLSRVPATRAHARLDDRRGAWSRPRCSPCSTSSSIAARLPGRASRWRSTSGRCSARTPSSSASPSRSIRRSPVACIWSSGTSPTAGAVRRSTACCCRSTCPASPSPISSARRARACRARSASSNDAATCPSRTNGYFLRFPAPVAAAGAARP